MEYKVQDLFTDPHNSLPPKPITPYPGLTPKPDLNSKEEII